MNPTKYVVHDTTRGYVGNSMVWWREGHHGYTLNLNEAHRFTWDELKGMDDDLVAYPVEEARKMAEPHVTTMPEGKQPLGAKFDEVVAYQDKVADEIIDKILDEESSNDQ